MFSLFTSCTYWRNGMTMRSQVIGGLEPVRIVGMHILRREVELTILLARHLRLLVGIRPGTCRLIYVWHLGLRHLRKLPSLIIRLWIWHDASSNTLTHQRSLTLTAILRMILLSTLSQHRILPLELVCWVLLLRCSLQRFEDQRLLAWHRVLVEGSLWTALVELMCFLFSARCSCWVAAHHQKRGRIIKWALFFRTLLSLSHVKPYLSSMLALVFIRRLVSTIVNRRYLVVHFLAAANRICQLLIVIWRWIQRHPLCMWMRRHTLRVFYADDVHRLAMFSNHVFFFVFNIVFQSWSYLRFNVF